MSDIVGILLAAGRGTRFGSDKLVHPLAGGTPEGTPIAVAAARNLRGVCERVVAVVRPDHDHLATLLTQAGCEVVGCADADKGMGHSLAAGVQASAEADGWVVALADMPFISSSSHQAVLNGLRGGASLAASEYQGRRGHPVGFSRKWFPELVAMTGDQGGKSILIEHAQELVLCAVNDPGVVLDIDRPDDLLSGAGFNT